MEMKEQLDKADKVAYPFLQWLISSNRSHIVKLAPDKVKDFTPFLLYLYIFFF